ncbi:MAG: hypothetical protein IKJ95_01615 [Bacteroidaceae bacterium]|nr:hypothetical protein [Bacteroidaceae bacterium]
MKKNLLYTMLIAFTAFAFTSCGSDDDPNPFNKPTLGEFNPTTITFTKASNNLTVVETWSDIVRDAQNRVTSYSYERKTTGYYTETETADCKIDYYTNQDGNEMIRSASEVEYYKLSAGIEQSHTKNISERIAVNSLGQIVSISTTTDLYYNDSTAPVITSSERTFTYSGEFCTSSSCKENDIKTTYRYNWSANQLKEVTILKENSANSTVEYSTFNYQYNTKELYRFSGTKILPFVQSGLPQIYASMGYFGKCTPYILEGEKQGGYTKFGNVTSPNTEVVNTYNFTGDQSYKVAYTGLSNIYNAYSITFSK